MLAWVVIDRTYSRQFLPKSSTLRTPSAPTRSGCLCVEFSDSLRPSSVVPTTYALPLATAAPQPLCNQSVTHSFYLDGGGVPLPTFECSNVLPSYPLSFQTLARSFVLFCTYKNHNSFVFKRFRTLWSNTGDVGRGPLCS